MEHSLPVALKCVGMVCRTKPESERNPEKEDLDSCPFREDVWDDPAPFCTCCDECRQACLYEI